MLLRPIQLYLTARLSEPAVHSSVCVADGPLSSYRVNLVLLVLLELLVPAVLLYVSQFNHYHCSRKEKKSSKYEFSALAV